MQKEKEKEKNQPFKKGYLLSHRKYSLVV
jgi:hypothetical protein